jgi:protein-S-isoprenylcysteine O-methyltransferase Ste14
MSQVELANLSKVTGKAETKRFTISPGTLDYFEKFVLIAMFSYFLIPVVSAIIARSDLPALLICISETLVVAMVCVRRRARTLSLRKMDWILALAATTMPMLVRPTEYSVLPTRDWPILLMLIGMAIQIFAKVNLGRRFGAVPANRGICHRGLYRIVRHPIYAGYMLTHIGFLLAASSWWNLGVYMLLYSIVVPRILAEERLLSEDHDYVAYCKKVPNRLIPGVF